MNANNTYNSGDANTTLIFTHDSWCFEHAWGLEGGAVTKKV